MSKQTAVEWLEEEINKQQKMYIDLAKKDKSLKKGVDAILTATTVLKMKCERAKIINEHQIISAFDNGYLKHTKTGKQYYNETFKD